MVIGAELWTNIFAAQVETFWLHPHLVTLSLGFDSAVYRSFIEVFPVE